MRSTIACALVFICSIHGLLLSGVLLSDVRADENEAKLQQHSHYAKRSGKTLTLTLVNGKHLAFVDKSDPDGAGGIKYEFVDYVQPIRLLSGFSSCSRRHGIRLDQQKQRGKIQY